MNPRIEHTLNIAAKECTIQFPGDLLSTNTEWLQRSVNTVIQTAELNSPDSLRYFFDLSRARLVDKTGMEFLKITIDRISRLGGEVYLRVANERVEESLMIARLHNHAEFINSITPTEPSKDRSM